MANDAKAIRELIEGKVALPSYPLSVSMDDIRKMRINRASGAARNAILCLLAHAKPKNFVTGADISLAKDHFSKIKDPNAHHIFPKSFLKKGLKRPVEEVHLLSELLFSTGGLEQQNQGPTTFQVFCGVQG